MIMLITKAHNTDEARANTREHLVCDDSQVVVVVHPTRGQEFTVYVDTDYTSTVGLLLNNWLLHDSNASAPYRNGSLLFWTPQVPTREKIAAGV